ncbi:MAG: hypothetical protein EKK51_18815 [Mycolicibacterium sp.]|nr:MAG: hypothetical protein EKK51_18815 [Mycolicibacterium sp.]
MGTPTSADLAAFTGKELNSDQATAVIQVITSMASAYTRGKGFTAGEPNSDIRAVILSASARLLADTSQIVNQESMGPFAVQFRAGFDGWSVAESYCLNRYRDRAY